jgi:hypothetical protein
VSLSSEEAQFQRRLRRRKRIVVAILLIALLPAAILLARIPLMMLGVEPFIHVYGYVSSDGGFDDIEVPEKGRTLTMVEGYFDDYKRQVGKPDLRLYRTTPRDWWRFWSWFDYATDPRWAYPYRERASNKGPGG